MATEELLQAEARERPRMAVVAGIAAGLTLIAATLDLLARSHQPDNLPASLLYSSDHQAQLALNVVCSVLGSLGLAFVLGFLYRATRARNPAVPRWLGPLPYIGGFGLVIVGVAAQVVLAVKLSHFASHGTQTYEEARKLLTGSDYATVRYLGILPQLALVISIVMIAIQAMRVGLLTRFMGYVGVISAVLFILPLVPVPIVQIFWLAALAALFLGRSPSGTPPAWSSGEAQPWPSAAEQREQRVRAAEARRGGGEVPQPADPGAARRKRKKRN